MNKVFEHAGDLVNVKVAHNLMRLIAEGFGDDDETANTQLRSSAVICWVLGEYGTADGKYDAAYITEKLCDIVEAYSGDETFKKMDKGSCP